MSTKDFSNKQERMIADYLDWKVVSGSGARPCHPGDVIGDDWLGECKTHEVPDKPIFFSFDVWQKICDEATFQHRAPVLFTDDGSQKSNRTWCLTKPFAYPNSWEKRYISKNFKKNFSMKHEQLAALYPRTEIDNGHKPIYYIATISDTKVAIVPLSLFKLMLSE